MFLVFRRGKGLQIYVERKRTLSIALAHSFSFVVCPLVPFKHNSTTQETEFFKNNNNSHIDDKIISPIN